MPSRTLGPPALKAQLGGLASQIREAGSLVVAFHAGAWDGPPTIDTDNRTWRVTACRSVLEVREALSSRATDQEPLVILTELGRPDLGADVVARLVKRRVFSVNAWEPVLRAFGAQRMDARLNGLTWLADVLLDGTPADGYPKLPSGTLDATTAWRWAVRVMLGAQIDEPDASSLLAWTLDEGVLARWAVIPPDRASELARWLLESIGGTAELPLALIANGQGAQVVPVGIVCGALFMEDNEPSGVCGVAAIRLERWTGGLPINLARGRALATAAEEFLGTLTASSSSSVKGVLTRADELLRELGAETEAWRSRRLPRGFHQRLDRFAQALTEALESADVTAAMVRAVRMLQDLHEHASATDEAERISRAEHALRLTRYLRTRTDTVPSSFADVVSAYASDHAFADVARYGLYASESHGALGAVLADVADRVVTIREQITAQFAQLARGWFEAPSEAPGLVPIEKVLASVVAPLAEHTPVLLVVIDGMSATVADSLSASIVRRGWVQIGPKNAHTPVFVIPALPSVTEACRTSLLCGKLRTGTAPDERSGFALNHALVALSKPALPPKLFHKADLGAAAKLAVGVAAAIADRDQRIIGAVVNAVDDHLLKDDMVRAVWTAEYVPVIGALCDAASAAGRALIITADHGHVLDLKLTEKVDGNGADRYRRAEPPLRDGEVLVSGPRVLTDDGCVVVAAVRTFALHEPPERLSRRH